MANLLEVSLLTGFSHYSYQLFQLLFITALIRSLTSCLLAFLYHYFTLMMRAENHEQRYYHFIWVASSVKSDVYFMQKNISEIENVMKNAYQLNQSLQDATSSPENQAMALSIARDVHEIKKDYQNVMRGLGDYFDDSQNGPMQLADILKVTLTYIRSAIREKHQDIIIDVHSDVDLVIPNHYYVVSILSNLIFNSVDALAGQPHGLIHVTVADNDTTILLNVSDNGSGISPETLALIFHPGFTTKFNEATGDVYRGIGLSHVQKIVQDIFNGHIQVSSVPHQETNFQVTLNKQRLSQEVSA